MRAISIRESRQSVPEQDFEEDPRYTASLREAWIAAAYWAIYTVVITTVAWVMGYGKTAAELDFIFGFPAWFFWSAGVATLIFCIIPYFLIKYLFTEVSLLPHGEDSNSPASRPPRESAVDDETGGQP